MILSKTISRSFASTAANAAVSQKLYADHIPLSAFQKVALAIGSGVNAIIDPYRHDLVADFGETTGHQALKCMHKRMSEDPEGQQILSEKPRLHTTKVDYNKLAAMPSNTLGYKYSQFYTTNQVSPDTRRTVQFVDDAELAYVMQRYRELHDLVHTVLEQPTTIRGEVIVKAFEGVQTGLPLCVLGGIFGPIMLSNAEKLEYVRSGLPWAVRCAKNCRFLMNVYFEKRFEQDIDDLRNELNISLLTTR